MDFFSHPYGEAFGLSVIVETVNRAPGSKMDVVFVIVVLQTVADDVVVNKDKLDSYQGEPMHL